MTTLLRTEVTNVLQGKLKVVSSVGDNISCICPFHKGGMETRPSFYVYVGPPHGRKVPGMAFCHTCNKGWSLKGLLSELGLPRSRIDAITKHLPEPPRKTSIAQQTRGIRFDNPVLPEILLGVYDRCPVAMLDAGFDKEVLRQFEIGFDVALNRITFPLRDHLGNLIGISGRAVLRSSFPRYLVYTGNELRLAGDDDTELLRACSGYKLMKGRFLWNLHTFYPTALMGTIPYVFIVEGFKQAMWLHQAGYKYVVALMGSHMTTEQITLIMRLGAPIFVFLDNDIAGMSSTRKLLPWLRKQSSGVYQIQYPKNAVGISPDDLTPEELRSLLMEQTNDQQIRRILEANSAVESNREEEQGSNRRRTVRGPDSSSLGSP